MSKPINEQWRTLPLNSLQAAAIVLEVEIDTLPKRPPASVLKMAQLIRDTLPPIRDKKDYTAWYDLSTGQRREEPGYDRSYWTCDLLRPWLESTPDLAQYRPAVLFGDKPAPAGAGLSRLVGLLALVIAEKAPKYKRGGKPNANQIAEAVLEQLAALPDVDHHGLGSSKIREHIAAGLAALEK